MAEFPEQNLQESTSDLIHLKRFILENKAKLTSFLLINKAIETGRTRKLMSKDMQVETISL
jgi:hypothetical protein